jgi:hypothetical protein
LDQFAQSRESETASPSEIPTRTGSPRNRRLPPSIPRRSTYSLSLPRPTDAQPHLVFRLLALQRVDPGLQTSHRRNLSLQPSKILPDPVPPLALVHALISVSLRRGFVPLSRRRQARLTQMSQSPCRDCSEGRATGSGPPVDGRRGLPSHQAIVRLTSAQLFSMIPQGCHQAPDVERLSQTPRRRRFALEPRLA